MKFIKKVKCQITSRPRVQLLAVNMELCLPVPLWMEMSSQTLLSASGAKAAALLGTPARSSPNHGGKVYHPVGNCITLEFNLYASKCQKSLLQSLL